MATVAELKAQAKELGIKGYSKMLKPELEGAIAKATAPVVRRLSATGRTENYYQQNGSGKLTPRQRRRIAQKERKNG